MAPPDRVPKNVRGFVEFQALLVRFRKDIRVFLTGFHGIWALPERVPENISIFPDRVSWVF